MSTLEGEPLFVGVDGGGTGLRVVVVDRALHVVAQTSGQATNPSAIGRERAAQGIAEAVRVALAHIAPDAGAAVAIGLGVAGAAASHSCDWLLEVAAQALPGVAVAPSADYEIALVGAFGRRQGLLVLAGTGSLAYGVDVRGESALVGGWGYLLGDEGGGYWLGMQALRAACTEADGGAPSPLGRAALAKLGMTDARTLVPWLYRREAIPVAQVAALAPLALAQAAAGDPTAQGIVVQGAQALAHIARQVAGRLRLVGAPVTLAGGLLSVGSPLRRALCQELGIEDPPPPLYTPAIGAAILARERWEQAHG